MLGDIKTRGRGRPKGSKNKPKESPSKAPHSNLRLGGNAASSEVKATRGPSY